MAMTIKNLIKLCLFLQLLQVSHGVELMKIVSRSLLSLYDGGDTDMIEEKQKMLVIGAGNYYYSFDYSNWALTLLLFFVN